MPARCKIPEDIQNQVRQRANFLCEYCHASEQWQYVAFTSEGADALYHQKTLPTPENSQAL